MDTEKFDVVVIGAGLGGLTSAAYLAKAGKTVLVLEHNPVPGGYAQEFRRGKYRFEAALHAMDGVGAGGWTYPILKDLDLLGKIQFHRLDPIYTARYPDHEIVAHADPLEYEAELIRHFPHERDSIRAVMAEMIEIYWSVRRYISDGENNCRPPVAEIPIVYPKMLPAMTMSLDDFLVQFIQDKKLRSVFATLWPYFGLPSSKLNAATFIFPFVSFHLFGAYYPEGGSKSISRALEQTIVENGGELRYRQTVNRIEIKDGRAVTVETEKGLRVEADVIISNANTPDTLLKFVGKEHLPKQYQTKVESEPNSVATFCVYLGLDRELKAEGFRHHELFVIENYSQEEDYQSSLNGDFHKTGMGMSNYDLVDTTCAPEGGSVLALISLADWNTNNQWGTGGNLENYRHNPQYLELKEAVADELIDRAEKLIPGLRKSIKYKEIATPMTNWRYSQNPGGGIYGSAQSVDNMYFNRVTAKTPIPNLFLAGAWAFGGGMSAALLSGRETSRLVKGYLNGENADFLMGVEIPKTVDGGQLTVDSEKSVSDEQVVVKEKLPDVTLKAIGSGREVSLRGIGKPAVLLFHTQETADEAAKVNAAIRAVKACQTPDQLFIANVVDLHAVPKLFRNFAESAMKDSYKKAAETLPTEANPSEYVLILPDWDGSLTKAAGLSDVDKTAGVIVLDDSGHVVETYQGDDAANVTVGFLKKIGR
jgi:phytoene dehydrogenase-like protein